MNSGEFISGENGVSTMFFRRSLPLDRVAIGRSFSRRRRDDAIEIAQVLGISPDGFGIPHVRYELTVEKPLSHGVYPAGTKVLSLSQFSATYPEALA
ncbi:MAG: hypothetical protein R8L07_17945 [Alphaproteobacteria bacterium]|nr:hypothetical protein [Alphaproteobacteria bacterium]